MSDSSKEPGVSKKKIYGAGTILALIISIPAIIAFLVAQSLIDNFFISIGISAIVYFVAMGFSIKISKKLSKM
jgi:ABC-type Mn2+/Zn2+ transport system permease subunit